MPRSSKWPFPSGLPTKTRSPLLYPISATYPTDLIFPCLITQIISDEYRLCTPHLRSLFIPVTSSLKGPNILLSTLSLNTLNLHSSFNGTKWVSHPYKQNYSSIYLNLYFWIASWKTKYSALNDSKHPLSSNCYWFLIPNRMNLQISEQVVLPPAVITSAPSDASLQHLNHKRH